MNASPTDSHNLKEIIQMLFERLLEQGKIPDEPLRILIRIFLYRGLRKRYGFGVEKLNRSKRALLRKFRRSPIAIQVQNANVQHYEVDSRLFELTLGPWLKYSCCYWPEGCEDLENAEQAMLELVCRRGRLEDGMSVLDLGCGWGSLTRWIADNYPNCHVTALSNSQAQGDFIRSRCSRSGFTNVRILTGDVNQVEFKREFDRVFSIEMFEHMKNYQVLLAKIATWLKPGAKLFVHHFSHREFLYEFNTDDAHDFMARRYFAGGTMPSDDLLLYFQDDLLVTDHWRVSGLHYARTLRAWLDNLYTQRRRVETVFAEAYGPEHVKPAFTHWRLFFLICEGTFALNKGDEYFVTQVLLEKR